MLQNAKQIMAIVRGTFPNVAIQGSNTASECTWPKSDEQILNCLWSNVTRKIQSLEQGQAPIDEALQTLKDVCTKISRRTGHSLTVTSFVKLLRPS